MTNLLQQAVSDLSIDVPVMRTESTEGGALNLYLYGGRVVTWREPRFADTENAAVPSPPSPNPGGGGPREGSRDDLTAIPGVGNATAQALIDAGYRTFADLRAATNQQLLQVQHINTGTLAQILDFLEKHIAPDP